MQALRKMSSGPCHVELAEVPAPTLGPRGVFDLAPMITHHYALEEWETAFENLRRKQDVKALIHPNGTGWA